MVYTFSQLTLQTCAVQVAGQPRPQIHLLWPKLPPRPHFALIRDEIAVCVDQCAIQLGVSMPGSLPEMSADHVVQPEPIGVAAILTDQRELGQSQTELVGLKARPSSGVLPVAGQHLTRNGDVRSEYRQFQI